MRQDVAAIAIRGGGSATVERDADQHTNPLQRVLFCRHATIQVMKWYNYHSLTSLTHKTMNQEKVIAAVEAAKEMQQHAIGVSFDALFVVAYLTDNALTSKQCYRTLTVAMPPEFRSAIEIMSGRSMTAAAIHDDFFKRHASPADAKRVGAWLRQLGKIPRKSNGNAVFDL